MIALIESATRRLRAQFRCAPSWFVAAPRRVNLIGEHTDYNDGYALPMANRSPHGDGRGAGGG